MATMSLTFPLPSPWAKAFVVHSDFHSAQWGSLLFALTWTKKDLAGWLRAQPAARLNALNSVGDRPQTGGAAQKEGPKKFAPPWYLTRLLFKGSTQ
ncbi:hypothetical protein C8F04DRAFT_1253495 [Mycena alexandri]|uniref:Uncharacterized protein n=1 Tax=Mycena alexandri TaxID=1745969 RepID=A0AAD6T9L6_9AGAR|nr:hypothetical protein C8F04DRAFT_1253495 [Mycena alexandri]